MPARGKAHDKNFLGIDQALRRILFYVIYCRRQFDELFGITGALRTGEIGENEGLKSFGEKIIRYGFPLALTHHAIPAARDHHHRGTPPFGRGNVKRTFGEHTFQFSLSTDKAYPSYWDMQSSVSYLNGYTELWGTPGLKPMTNYNLNGSYILKQKYIFNLFFMHTPDYFIQTPYQSTDRLALIYKNTNWNYMQLWGANIILPFKTGNWLDSRLTVAGMQMRQRCDDFFDIPFNRKKWVFSAMLDNTFKVNKNLAFELMGNVQTPVIQGTFDIESIFNLTAGLKWSFANDRMSLSARCNDILNTGMPKTKVRFKGQDLDMNSAFYSRAFTLNLSYRFGGYKKKNLKEVDTSRFGM